MVSATHGVLFTGDVALIEFIRALNDKQPVADKFIIEGALGDQHLLIREQRAQWVLERVAEWQQSLRFEPKQQQ